MNRTAAVIAILATLLVSFRSATVRTAENPPKQPGDSVAVSIAPAPPSACPTCRKRVTVPFVRAALVQTGMYVAAGALWPEAYSPFLGQQNRRQFKESWTNPPEYNFDPNPLASDGDWWTFNFLLHGLFGSEMYLAARDWGHRPVIAFLFAVFASTAWEYLIEGWAKQPSAIDLVWTPGFGSLLGELRFRAVRGTYRLRNRRAGRVLRTLVDPLGEMERAILRCRVP